jgi:hypothetical protein
VNSEAQPRASERRATRRVRLVVYNLLFVVVIVSIARRISSDDLRAVGDVDSPGLLVIATGLFGVFYGALATVWLLVARMFQPTTLPRVAAGFFAAQPFKYLPTSVFSFSARVKYARDCGVATGSAIRATLLDAVLFIGSGAALWLATGSYVALIIVVSVSFACLVIVARGWEKLAGVPLVGRVLPPRRPSAVDAAVVAALLGVAWLVSGVALYLVARAYDVPTDTFGIADAIRSNAVSYAASIAAVFAPAGIGVREALLLEADLPASVIVSWRLLTTAVDLVAGSGAIVLFMIWRKAATAPEE